MEIGLPPPAGACVFGAGGGIGGALVDALTAMPGIARIDAGARTAPADIGRVCGFAFDLEDEATIAAAAERLATPPPRLVIVATGVLHAAGMVPEKSLRMQSADAYARAFAINTIGPALIAKHVLPRMPRQGRAVFAVLSARVGSIADNRLGGWHAYRASKAALNMVVRNLAIETARTHPEAVVAALHPGTVATGLSAPFRGGVPPERLFTPAVAAGHLLRVIGELGPADSGGLFAWDGQRIAF